MADQPVKAAVLGAGRLLRDLNGMPEGMIDIPMRPTAARETARPDRDYPRSDRDYPRSDRDYPRADRDRRDYPRSDRGNSYNSYDSGSRDSRGAGITTGTAVTATAMAAAGGSKAVKTGMFCI